MVLIVAILINSKKSLLLISICITLVMGDTKRYINALAFGTSSINLSGANHVENNTNPCGYPLHLNYFNYQPNSRKAYPAVVPYPYIILHPVATSNCVGFPPIIVPSNKLNLSAKPKAGPAILTLPFKTSPKPNVEIGSSRNELEADTEKGFKLIKNLVKTISLAAGTASDSDPAEVNAVKSIFSDIMDEVIRQIEPSFKENNVDTTLSDAFVHISETTRKAIADAPNQTILTAILKPYVTSLREFASKGLQTTTP